MKKLSVVMGGALALMAAPALAGINPTAPGLPGQVGTTVAAPTAALAATWTVTAGRGYAAAVVTGNPASTMCVECHEVNPSDKIALPSQGAGYPIVRTDLTNQGTHVVMNMWAPAAAVASTNSGGGWAGSFGNARVAREYEKVNAWTTGALSKYGDGAGYVTVTAPSSGDPDMLCESCHNVLINGGNQLLVGAYADNGADNICVGCHSATKVETNDIATGYGSFHANGNLPPLGAAAARKRHHVLEGENYAAANYGPRGTNTSVMWAPSYTQELGNTGKGLLWVVDAGSPYTPAPFEFRGLWNKSGQGTRATALAAVTMAGAPLIETEATVGDIQTGAQLRCTSCHRPHNAKTGSGAFILRLADNKNAAGAARNDYPGVGVGGVAYVASKANGIRRQSDVVVTNGKIYGEYVALCNGCHVGYGR